MEAAFLQISTKSGTDEDMMNAPGMDRVRGRWITPYCCNPRQFVLLSKWWGEISINFLPSAWVGFDRSDVH